MEILVWLGALLFFVLVAALVTARSMASRKTYRCPVCSEEQRVELMDASRCSHCGAPLGEAR